MSNVNVLTMSKAAVQPRKELQGACLQLPGILLRLHKTTATQGNFKPKPESQKDATCFNEVTPLPKQTDTKCGDNGVPAKAVTQATKLEPALPAVAIDLSQFAARLETALASSTGCKSSRRDLREGDMHGQGRTLPHETSGAGEHNG